MFSWEGTGDRDPWAHHWGPLPANILNVHPDSTHSAIHQQTSIHPGDPSPEGKGRKTNLVPNLSKIVQERIHLESDPWPCPKSKVQPF